MVDLDAFSDIDGLDEGEAFILGDHFIDLLVMLNAAAKVKFCIFKGPALIVHADELDLLDILADYFFIVADRFDPK